MIAIDSSEIWKQIPPEEKFEIMSKAHASGIGSSLIVIVIGCTIAVGLKLSFLIWGSLLLSPFVFQFTAGKAWRGLRPRIMLEYLAARSAARRYAFANNGKDLTLAFLFKGRLTELFDREEIHRALEAAVDNTIEAEVWVALFNDSVVMMAEHSGGAELRFAQVLNEKLTIESTSLDGKGDYSQNKEIVLTSKIKDGMVKRVRLTSRYPAALIVFEKKLLTLQSELKKQSTRFADAIAKVADVLEDDVDNLGL